MVFDQRDIRSGAVVSDLNGYYDCQNIVGFPSGRMVVLTHHSQTREGAACLRLKQTASTCGKIWDGLTLVEPGENESHDGYMLQSPDLSKLWVFYGYNEHQLRDSPRAP